MRRRGYTPHCDAPTPPSFIEKMFLLGQDKYFKIKFKIKRYGLGLVVAGFLAKKLKLTSIERTLKIRFNKRTEIFLK